MKKTNFKKGISLIILIITIVVIIILAVTVILTLNKNNPINSAKEASFKSQVAAYKEAVKLAKMEVIVKNEGDYDILNDKTIQDGLGLKDEFKNALLVKNGELVYDIKSDIKLQQLFESVGVKCQYKLHIEKDATGDKVVPIPEGFVVSSDTTENTIDQGLVIKQGNDPASTTSNEFVWVPVPNPATEYKRGVTGDATDISSYTENDSDPTNIAIKNSVFKYNGFYIGRYETGLNVDAEYGGGSDGTNWREAKPVVIRGARPWNYISQTKAMKVSESLVNTASAKSRLINSYMWDTTLNYIISSKEKTQIEVVSDSTSWGNYVNETFQPLASASYSTNWSTYTKVSSIAKPSYTWWLLTTGATNRNSAKNIYDLAGNLWEWTTENVNSSDSASCRGGICGSDGSSFPAVCRRSASVENIVLNYGFRSGLYLL